jgi:hypothetical protein
MTEAEQAAWTPGLRDLWQRIECYDFDPAVDLSFTRRLARERTWSLPFARTAIREYRRFCFLAVALATPATPSEDVDEVWHLHLTYSREYWGVWCGQVLGAPLHHDPTRGGPAETNRFRTQYAATLAAYQRFFGPPDATIWPATHRRFRSMPRFRSVDRDRWFVVPRPRELLRRVGLKDIPECR